MDDLLADFIAESRDMLEALGGEIVVWEADPGDRTRLDSIFRFVHTVKGNCGFFDFPRLESLSHAAEGALADVRAGRRQADPVLVSAVLAIIDRIGEMIDAIDAGDPFPEGGDSALIDALEPGAEAVENTSQSWLPASNAGPSRSVPSQRTIRLSVELLDRVMSGVSDMVLARNDLARQLREGSSRVAVDHAFDRLSAIIAEMREAITRTRMQRIESLFTALPRMVRDLSAELGKQILIDIESGDVELDREMIEMIRDPLTHIIRNAIDHGIEAPGERREAGKREIGLLSVSAHQSGNQISIVIADDGRGIDGHRLVEKAIASGVFDAVGGARLSPRERIALVFEPGISTAGSVTAVSGRGVGMDVVRSNVERIGGVVEVDTTPGQGTRITLRVPLTLTIISALTVSIGGQHFAIPHSAIEEIILAGASSVEFSQTGDSVLAMIRGRRVPCVALADLFGLTSEVSDEERLLVVLRLAGGDLFTVAVDRIHDHEELVVKPVAPAVMAAGIYAGTTLDDDGSPILLLDAVGLAKVGGLSFEAQDRSSRFVESIEAGPGTRSKRVLLFVGLDGQRRAMPMAIVDRIEEVEASAVQSSAGHLRVVIDDRILPLVGTNEASLSAETVLLFRLRDGESEIGYVFREVIDMKVIDGELIPAEGPGEIAGVTLIDGVQAELVDPHWLFAQRAKMPETEARLVCRLPANDPWIQNLLRPLVEAAGYRVVSELDEDEADLAFAAREETATPGQAAQVIWLRSSPSQMPGDDDSIYRYDRAGLMIAMRSASTGRGL